MNAYSTYLFNSHASILRAQSYYKHHAHTLVRELVFLFIARNSVKQKHVHIKVKTVTNAQTTDYITSITDAAGN